MSTTQTRIAQVVAVLVAHGWPEAAAVAKARNLASVFLVAEAGADLVAKAEASLPRPTMSGTGPAGRAIAEEVVAAWRR